MSKFKAFIITTVSAVLLGGILYLTNSYMIRWFRIFEMILAAYGYIEAIYIFYNWLLEPPADAARHTPTLRVKDEMDPVRDSKTIPETWVNPFTTNVKTSAQKPSRIVPGEIKTVAEELAKSETKEVSA